MRGVDEICGAWTAQVVRGPAYIRRVGGRRQPPPVATPTALSLAQNRPARRKRKGRVGSSGRWELVVQALGAPTRERSWPRRYQGG